MKNLPGNKIFAFLFILSIFLNSILIVRAESTSIDYEQMALQLAESWKDCSYSGKQVEIEDSVPVINASSQIIGYCVSFYCEEESKGYVMIDLTKSTSECVVEFTLDGDSLYDILLQNAQNTLDFVSEFDETEKKIYCSASNEYGIAVLCGNETEMYFPVIGLQNVESFFTESADYDAAASPNIFHGIINGSEITGFTEDRTFLTGITSFIPVCTSDFPENNNCGPTALTILLSITLNVKDLQIFIGGII